MKTLAGSEGVRVVLWCSGYKQRELSERWGSRWRASGVEGCGEFVGAGDGTEDAHGAAAAQANGDVDAEDAGEQAHPREAMGGRIESGIADVRERLLLRVQPGELGLSAASFDAVLTEFLDHRAKIESSPAPVLVLHAAADHIVPVAHGESIAAWAGERGTLQVFPQGDHNTIFAYNADAIVETTASFVRRVTGGGRGPRGS